MQTVYHNARIAHPSPDGARTRIVEDAVLVVQGVRIAWVGARADFRGSLDDAVDLRSSLVTPAFVDCHTHLVFAGDRTVELARRLRGETYAQIAASGGGIVTTVRATRAASDDELLQLAVSRARALQAEGVRWLEIKSGYGLSVDDELRMLRVARQVAEVVPVEVHTTLLAAHAVPPEYAGRPDAWVDVVCDTIIPAAASEGLADSVDVFCETVGFSLAQTERVFEAAQRAGLPIRGHTEQLSNLGGSRLAASMGALSVDHIEYLEDDDVNALAAAGTVAVLLPLPFIHLGETRRPPIAALRAAGVPMAVASDFNPGSSPLLSLRLAMHLACTTFGLTTDEALAGVTLHAARALGWSDRAGAIAPGLDAGLLVWPADVTIDQLAGTYRPDLQPVDLAMSARSFVPPITVGAPSSAAVTAATDAGANGGSAGTAHFASVWTGRSDPEDGPDAERWWHRVQPWVGTAPAGCAVLVGLACDAGVARNRGRVGAAVGPDAMRRALANVAWLDTRPVFDAGDVVCVGDALESAQQAYADRVASVVGAGALPVGLGGGHEIAWGTWSGVRSALPTHRVGVLNVDAHLDLRTPCPQGTSGTPFSQIAQVLRQADEPFDYLCVGASEHANTAALFRRALELGATWWRDDECLAMDAAECRRRLDAWMAPLDAVYLTICLDAFSAAVAPGVSAPAAVGLPVPWVLALVDHVLSSGRLVAVDIAELNPGLDQDQRTARLAARLVSQMVLQWRQP